MAFNVVTLVLIMCALGVVSDEASPKRTTGRALAFPFSSPVGYLVDGPSSFNGQQDFNHFCFKYVYGTVKFFSRKASHGTLSDQLASLCREKENSRCKRWATELQEIVDAKKGPRNAQKPDGKKPRSYQSWCSEVFEESSGVPVTEHSVTQVNGKTKNNIVSRKAWRSQAPHALARSSSPAKPAHASSVASKVSTTRHVVQNKPGQSPHDAVVVKALPQQTSSKHVKVEDTTDKQAMTSAEPVQRLHQDSDRSSTKADGNSKKDDCACVHRDGKEICHCVGEEEKKVASLASQHLGDIVRGYAIAIEAKAVQSQSDIEGALGSLSKALSSASHLEATK